MPSRPFFLALGVASVAGCIASTGLVEEPKTNASPSTDGGAASSDGGAPLAEVCPAPAVRNDFESALDPSWVVSEPSAFRLDAEEPITGTKSLRIAYQQRASYITIAQPNVCAVRVAFTLRADAMLLGAGGVTVARVVAGTGTWFHVLMNGRHLSLAQEFRTAEAAGIGFGPPTGDEIVPDVPFDVAVTVDLRTKASSLVVARHGQPLPQPVPRTMRQDTSRPSPAINAVELGAAPGVESSGVGVLWMDDLAID